MYMPAANLFSNIRRLMIYPLYFCRMLTSRTNVKPSSRQGLSVQDYFKIAISSRPDFQFSVSSLHSADLLKAMIDTDIDLEKGKRALISLNKNGGSGMGIAASSVTKGRHPLLHILTPRLGIV